MLNIFIPKISSEFFLTFSLGVNVQDTSWRHQVLANKFERSTDDTRGLRQFAFITAVHLSCAETGTLIRACGSIRLLKQVTIRCLDSRNVPHPTTTIGSAIKHCFYQHPRNIFQRISSMLSQTKKVAAILRFTL